WRKCSAVAVRKVFPLSPRSPTHETPAPARSRSARRAPVREPLATAVREVRKHPPGAAQELAEGCAEECQAARGGRNRGQERRSRESGGDRRRERGSRQGPGVVRRAVG